MARKSAPRWWTIGSAVAARTAGGTGVGPGVNRYRFSMTVRLASVNVVLSFCAALIALRLAGELARRRRFVWAAGLLTYAAAAAALAWGTAHGWDTRSFRVYYLAGGLLTAPLLGAGSLLLTGRNWATAVALAYAGLAVGVVLAMPVHGNFAAGGVPTAGKHLGRLPQAVAIAGNSL